MSNALKLQQLEEEATQLLGCLSAFSIVVKI